MSETLVLRLDPDAADRCRWVVAGSDGRSSLPETGSLLDAAQRAQQRPVMALVPGTDVLLSRIELPVRGSSKMLQAAPYALEEDIADSIGEMHFAIGRRHADGKVTVGAIRESLLLRWLDEFDAAGLNVVTLMPESCGIPDTTGTGAVIVGDRALIRDRDGNVVVAETEALAAYVAAMGIDEQSEGTTELWLSEADAGTYSQTLSELRMAIPELSIVTTREDVLPIMAGAALANPDPNLLQGGHARMTDTGRLWQPWRTAAALAGVLVLVALGAKALEVMSLKSEMGSLNAEISSIASEAMPGSRLVDPMLQLEQLAAGMRGGTGDSSNFLLMLDALSKALSAAGGTTLGRLDYRNGLMDLTLTAPDVDTLDRISRSIEEIGLSAEIQSANQRDDGGYQGRIRIAEQST